VTAKSNTNTDLEFVVFISQEVYMVSLDVDVVPIRQFVKTYAL